MFKKWLHEPLLHFLLIGAAIFALYGLQNDQPAETDHVIVISSSDIDRLVSLWEKKWQRLPTQTEISGMIRAQVREEVLYREARAMGLDQDDSIVRRRLAQKLEFIFADLATQAEPADSTLREYLEKHPAKFEIPAHISFQQIYLNSDRRGEQVQSEATQLLKSLTQGDPSIDILSAGDPFMFGQQHENLTEHAVARLFGKEFASALFTLQPGAWQGPVTSGYGLHLVRISDRTPARLPQLDTIRDKVFSEWQTEQRRKMNEDFYQNLRSRYDVMIEKDSEKNSLDYSDEKK